MSDNSPRCPVGASDHVAIRGSTGPVSSPDALASHTLLTTALVGALLPPDVPGGYMLRSWMDSWSGVGHVLDAMTASGHHVELRQSVFGWRAEFYREAMQHSRSTWAGVGTDPLPWRAVQMGALDVLKRANREEVGG
jgi:hypothetical protein